MSAARARRSQESTARSRVHEAPRHGLRRNLSFARTPEHPVKGPRRTGRGSLTSIVREAVISSTPHRPASGQGAGLTCSRRPSPGTAGERCRAGARSLDGLATDRSLLGSCHGLTGHSFDRRSIDRGGRQELEHPLDGRLAPHPIQLGAPAPSEPKWAQLSPVDTAGTLHDRPVYLALHVGDGGGCVFALFSRPGSSMIGPSRRGDLHRQPLRVTCPVSGRSAPSPGCLAAAAGGAGWHDAPALRGRSPLRHPRVRRRPARRPGNLRAPRSGPAPDG